VVAPAREADLGHDSSTVELAHSGSAWEEEDDVDKWV
jgi:hypothetical protein